MLKFTQFVTYKRYDWMMRNHVTLRDVRRDFPAESFREEWEEYVVREFEQGRDMTPTVWRELRPNAQLWVFRTHRALTDPKVTRRLERMRAG